VIDSKVVVVPCTSWSHFVLAPHATYGTTQGAIKHDFWVRVLFKTNILLFSTLDRDAIVWNLRLRSMRTELEKNAKKVCKDAFSNARLQVVNAYMKRRGHSINNFGQYSDVYLTVDQYMEVKI
jgi:hypothetical protein